MSDVDSEMDSRFMKNALMEATKGLGRTSPNPTVGCVITKGEKIIAKGYHRSSGCPHAEIEAMSKASPRAIKGSTLYVTLEPCSSHGRTAPCSDVIIAAGIKRVVYGVADPNPAHQGKAKKLFIKQGIKVTEGVLGESCEALIRPFGKFITTGMPWVIAKAGISLDGRLTRPGNESQWLTNNASITDSQKLRGEVDAIIIGAGTVRADDPTLTIRDPNILKRGKTQPLRVILTRSGKLPARAKLLNDECKQNTLVYKGKSLRIVLRDLAKKHDCVSVLIEGGGILLGEAFTRKLVNEVCFYIAPIICGANCIPLAGSSFPSSTELFNTKVKRFGEDIRVRGLVVS